ncbi:PTS transporter subunit EIIC [Streptacidiphilus sp. PB12-B1b]|uniref:PTS transporter subunit EIIC n=1 Tax=Streptacidiphilus sp. PB12-B1b TaxID=2705012 RepID=UPI0015FBE7F1|nr:PTS transporter subunit EIIC [Streptacidiphilus sp. PB12-B1b]QMU80061.1 PTS transporter subunit EIIC [Streptacidiphilus sp. PB12-B1b]
MSSAGAVAPRKPWWQGLVSGLQKMGRSLQLPIAVLPAAGILNRLGQPDIHTRWHFPEKLVQVFGGAGGALLDGSLGLPLLFAVGVAIGMAKKSDGSTALAAVAGFLVYHNVLATFASCARPSVLSGQVCLTGPAAGPYSAAALPVAQNPGVFGGIVIGLMTAYLWQRYHRVKLVDWLGFFNGRRLVPIIMSGAALLFAVVCLWVWPPIGRGLDSFADGLTDLGSTGSGVFGVANRLLLVVGLHQFLNVFFWFQFGSYTEPDGTVVHGDVNRFLAGDPTAGQFTSGFFPIMMFALPAAAMAIAHCAKPSRRKEVTGMMVSVALTSFMTGVTEPIEYSFLYVAPVLYAVHALLTGVSMAVTWAVGVHDGFSFSAGLIDYVINWSLATKPWLILPIGAVFAVVYYTVFRVVITVFDLKTPGREDDADELEQANVR